MICSGNRTICSAGLAVFVFLGMLQAQPSLRITSPQDGIEVAPGDTVTFDVKVDGNYLAVIIAGKDPINLVRPRTAPPYLFSVHLPAWTRPGKYVVTALGFKEGGKDESPRVTVDVERPNAPRVLTVYPPRLVFSYIGEFRYVDLSGDFDDDHEVNLAESTKTTWSANPPSIVKIDPSGRATAVAPGVGSITVTYRNLKIVVPVVVPDKAPPKK